MSKLNAKATVNAIVKLAEVVIQYNTDANYDVDTTPELNMVSKEFVKSQKLNQQHLNQLLDIRESYESLIDRKYGTELNTPSAKMISNMVRDTQSHLAENDVPQRTQVALGLFDLVIGRVYQPAMFA